MTDRWTTPGTPSVAPAPITEFLKNVFKPLASLRLTIVCLACAMFIVFVGTLHQVQIGLYEAQLRHFQSFFPFFSLPGSEFPTPSSSGGYSLAPIPLTTPNH